MDPLAFSLSMAEAAIILALSLIVFAVGKSPVFRMDRAGAAIVGASLMIGLNVISLDQAAAAVDYRTIVVLFAMMIVTSSLRISGFFHLVGEFLVRVIRTRRQLLLAVILAGGLLSALFVNDIVCLVFTPIVLMICHRRRIDPVPFLIGLATASNIGSAGTLIGNPQNILIGSLSGMPFVRYLLIAFPLALAGLFLDYLFVSRAFRPALEGPLAEALPAAAAHYPLLIGKNVAVTALILAGFLIGLEPAIVAAVGAAALLVTRRVKPEKVYSGIDFNLLVIFVGLFVIIGGVAESGLMRWLMNAVRAEHLRSFPAFAGTTVLLSNVFSNVPAVLLLKFFVPAGAGLNWWAGLAVFSTLAGNLTLVGSVANLIVVEIARRDGVRVRFMDYLRVGFPLTVVLCLIALGYFALLT